MSDTLAKALIVLVPVAILFAWSALVFRRRQGIGSFVQLLGAGGLVVVVLTHICEALQLLSFMEWGSPQSVGHYLDLISAIVGLTLFPIGLLFQILTKRRT